MFERTCGLANGYLKKQHNGKGTLGSEIIEKISANFPDLDLVWLLTGKRQMLADPTYMVSAEPQRLSEEDPTYLSREQLIENLKEKIRILENALADKEKIIRLMEANNR